MRRSAALLPALALIAPALLAGCGGQEAAKAGPSEAATPSAASTTTAPPAPRPKVGACYRLDFTAATSPTSDAAPVPCSGKHNAVTVYVGTIDPISDGHLLTVDSDEVQAQLATTCPTKVGPWVGGTVDDQRLSRFQAIWFGPTLAQSDAGANWFRCDLVAVRGDQELADLPGTAKAALAGPSGLDRFGTCGNDAPSAADFQRVMCAKAHSWRAVKVIAIAKDATYLAAEAQSLGDDACKVEAQQRATDPLVYKWSFEWPTKAAWDRGQRYGLCWVPST